MDTTECTTEPRGGVSMTDKGYIQQTALELQENSRNQNENHTESGQEGNGRHAWESSEEACLRCCACCSYVFAILRLTSGGSSP